MRIPLNELNIPLNALRFSINCLFAKKNVDFLNFLVIHIALPNYTQIERIVLNYTRIDYTE